MMYCANFQRCCWSSVCVLYVFVIVLCSVGDLASKRHGTSRKYKLHHHHHYHHHHHHNKQYHHFNHHMPFEKGSDANVDSSVSTLKRTHQSGFQNLLNFENADYENPDISSSFDHVLQSWDSGLPAESRDVLSMNEENMLGNADFTANIESSAVLNVPSDLQAQTHSDNPALPWPYPFKYNVLFDKKYTDITANHIDRPYYRTSTKHKSRQFFPDVSKDVSVGDVATATSLYDNTRVTSDNLDHSGRFDADILHGKVMSEEGLSRAAYHDTSHKVSGDIYQETFSKSTRNQTELLQDAERNTSSHDGYNQYINSIQYQYSPRFQQMDGELFQSLIESLSPSESEEVSVHWPVKREALVEGDLVLGGLMMVHEREETKTCGPVMPQGGIQALETMLYTLDVVNRRSPMIPNVTIGAHILDDCDKDTYGLEMAVDFIKGSISNIDGAEYHCNKTQVRKVISGVVGAASSVTSIQVANLLRLFKIPQVSFFSTSPELSNKQRFEFFSRTIPSDHYQVKAMVEIVKQMNWSYVSIIYEESNYGIKAFEELETLLAKNGVCIAVKEKLVKDSGVAEEIAYDNIVQKLLTKPRAKGVIIFGSDQEVAGVMRAVHRNNATGSFSWIGSDGWSARSLVSDGNEAEVEGTLSVQPQANPVQGFEEYFLNLTVESNRRNPWFVEFWEDHFQCRYPNSSRTPYNSRYKKKCDITERLHRDNTTFEGQLQFVSDAVMAFAHAFRQMHQEFCNGQPGLCDAMKPIKGTELLKFLRKVSFEGLSGDMFEFDPNGDGPARYNIIHFKQISLGKFQWIKVGEYLEGKLRLNMTEIQFKLGNQPLPESVCSLPCDDGQAKKYVEGEICCWHCFNCTQYQIRNPDDETQCLTCRQGTIPDPLHITCLEIPEVFLRPESGCAIGAMSLSSTGILITLFVCGVFIRHNDTPVVRASGRELSYVLLTGILLCYCVTFALVLRPTDVVCGIQRFGAGFCFTVVYAALLTKTNRIARIFNAGKRTAKRPSFISPRSQLFICTGLVGVQVLINGVWILVSPPRAMHHYPTREDNHLVCSSHIDASYMIAFGYPIVLIVVCTIYAILTRKIPEAFNESKHIGFTMYTTCVIWLAFVPLYFGTGNHVPLRITSMSVTISLSASVTLACLFSPKLYIILVHPERNVRQSMMPVRYSAIKSPAVTGTTQTGSMMAAVICNQQKQPLHSAVPQQSGSSQGLDSGLQSDGVDLELREDTVHQIRRYQSCLLVNRSTQTVAIAMSNTTSNSNCPNSQQQQPQQQHQSVAKLTTTCHIINSSSNGPISVSAAQQKQQIRDVQL